MTTTTAQLTAGTDGTCPSWCTGRHDRPSWVTEAEAPRYWHLSADCPAWCTGHLSGAPGEPAELDTHRGAETFVDLSMAPAVDHIGYRGPDRLAVTVWHILDEGAVTVSVSRTADDSELPPLVPDEAQALGMALIARAREARQGTPAANGVAVPAEECPSWCAQGLHDGLDDVHMSEGHVVPVTEHWFCSHEKRRSDGHLSTPCDEGVCVGLVNGDDGCPQVAVHHGDDCLPYVTLEAAEHLALEILALTATARAGRAG